jgi:hypothetical protein
LKKLKYENEKLFVDCQSLREAHDHSLTKNREETDVEGARKMLKRLSGEVDLLESYSLSLSDLVQEKFGRSRELTIVLD